MMKPLPRTTLRQQAVARRIDAWSEPLALPVQVPSAADYFAGFLRAAVQTVSPSAIRGFVREFNAQDRVLSKLSWALMFAVPAFAILAFLVPGAAQVNPWIKPIKFSLSFSTFATTISLFLLALRIPDWQLRLARRMIAASVALEIFSLGAQAWRSVVAHASQSLIDGSLNQLTNSMVMVNTAIVTWMFVLFCANRVRTDLVDWPTVSALRHSLIIFLAGNAIGGYMLARGTHTVGAKDGGPGLPFLNWSTTGGDLRIAHFIALHAIQIVPLFAYILAQMAPILPVRHRRMAIAALAIGVAVIVGATFVQAALGHPVLQYVMHVRR